MAVAIAAAPPLIAAGPPGWLVLGAIAAVSVGVAIWAMAEKADDAAGNEGTDCTVDCPNTGDDAEPVDKPREYPANPDDLVDEGYEETSHPKAAEKGVRRFKDSKTGDEVEFHKGKPNRPGWEGKDHYHRLNPNRTGKGDHYLDKSGRPAPKNSDRSHLEPGK